MNVLRNKPNTLYLYQTSQELKVNIRPGFAALPTIAAPPGLAAPYKDL
jgi:hypothetical protein